MQHSVRQFVIHVLWHSFFFDVSVEMGKNKTTDVGKPFILTLALCHNYFEKHCPVAMYDCRVVWCMYTNLCIVCQINLEISCCGQQRIGALVLLT